MTFLRLSKAFSSYCLLKCFYSDHTTQCKLQATLSDTMLNMSLVSHPHHSLTQLYMANKGNIWLQGKFEAVEIFKYKIDYYIQQLNFV